MRKRSLSEILSAPPRPERRVEALEYAASIRSDKLSVIGAEAALGTTIQAANSPVLCALIADKEIPYGEA